MNQQTSRDFQDWQEVKIWLQIEFVFVFYTGFWFFQQESFTEEFTLNSSNNSSNKGLGIVLYNLCPCHTCVLTTSVLSNESSVLCHSGSGERRKNSWNDGKVICSSAGLMTFRNTIVSNCNNRISWLVIQIGNIFMFPFSPFDPRPHSLSYSYSLFLIQFYS